MNNELQNKILVEKWRPTELKDLICLAKDEISEFLKYPLKMPSFLLYSASPGTGKTSLAKIMATQLKCDVLTLNASKERGIDTIREQVNTFAEHMSISNTSKRMVFMDEADFLTPQAMASLRNMIEEYSNNVFFVFSCNDIAKIIEPIRSRCVMVNFENPPKKEILDRLEYICKEEKIDYGIEILVKLMNSYYPDIRSMIKSLQNASLDKNSKLLDEEIEFLRFLKAIEEKDIKFLYTKTFDATMNLLGFNDWFFKYLMKNYKLYDFDTVKKIASFLADIEKNWNLGVNLDIIFIANILEISNILHNKKD